jgi:hypothetical protein
MAAESATGEMSTRIVDEQFLDLICSDTDLLTAEFEAIIATAWPSPPASGAAYGGADGRPAGRPGRFADRPRALTARPRHPGVGGWMRQRSPPSPQPLTSNRKGR